MQEMTARHSQEDRHCDEDLSDISDGRHARRSGALAAFRISRPRRTSASSRRRGWPRGSPSQVRWTQRSRHKNSTRGGTRLRHEPDGNGPSAAVRRAKPGNGDVGGRDVPQVPVNGGACPERQSDHESTRSVWVTQLSGPHRRCASAGRRSVDKSGWADPAALSGTSRGLRFVDLRLAKRRRLRRRWCVRA